MTVIDWVIIGFLLALIVALIWTWITMCGSEPARMQVTDIPYTVGEDAIVDSYDGKGRLVLTLHYRKNEHWRIPKLGDYLYINWGSMGGYRYCVTSRRACDRPGMMTVTCELMVGEQ